MKKLVALAAAFLVLSRVNAVTITQTFTLTEAGGAPGMGTAATAERWQFEKFDSSLGTLNRVEFVGNVKATFSSWERNQLQTPINWSGSTYLQTSFFIVDQGMFFQSPTSFSPLVGPSQTLATNQLGTFAATDEVTYIQGFTVDLSAFLGEGLGSLNQSSKATVNSLWGSGSLVTTTTMTLTYDYDAPQGAARSFEVLAAEGVPDGGYTAILFGLSLVGIIGCRRR